MARLNAVSLLFPRKAAVLILPTYEYHHAGDAGSAKRGAPHDAA